jgi:hypothetical protein
VARAHGDRFTGPVFAHLAGREFSGIVPDLHDGLVRLIVHRSNDRTGVRAVLLSYAPEDAARVEAFTAGARAVLPRIFPA